MFCPETIRIDTKHFMLTHYGGGDVDWKFRSRKSRWNPLRYQISFWWRDRGGYRFRINKQGRAQLKWSNFVWKHLGGRQRWERKNGGPTP